MLKSLILGFILIDYLCKYGYAIKVTLTVIPNGARLDINCQYALDSSTKEEFTDLTIKFNNSAFLYFDSKSINSKSSIILKIDSLIKFNLFIYKHDISNYLQIQNLPR